MKYYGQFRSIKDIPYTVYITTNNDESSTTELTLGGTPFTTEMADSKDTLYTPVKYQSATCNILTSDYNFDIYSGKSLGTKIELYLNNYQVLPLDYTQLDYIENTSTAYIDTGFIPNYQTRIIADVQRNETHTEYGRIFGAGRYNYKDGFMLDYENTIRIKFLNNEGWTIVNVASDNLRHTLDYNRNVVSMDGVELYTGDVLTPSANVTTSSVDNLAIFTYLSSDHSPLSTENFWGKVYSFKIYDNDVLIRNFIPAKSLNNVVGLYDLVNSKFYTSANSTNFIAGNTINTSTLEWSGYVEPNVYDMGFEHKRELVEINCIDGLSTLQYIKFMPSDKNTDSFINIINYIIQQCNCYSYIYVSDNTKLTSTSIDILNDLYISKMNFYDDDSEKTDKENAWTCLDVLEEICRYLGLTAMSYKNSVYFLDYDAIKNGNNMYYQYTVGSSTGVLKSLSYAHTIDGTDYSSNGSTLSLDNVYNKTSVSDDITDFDDILPDLFDNLKNITASSDTGSVAKVTTTIGSAINGNMEVLLDYAKSDRKHKDNYLIWHEYFDNPNLTLYKYTYDKSNWQTNHTLAAATKTTMSYSELCDVVGATIVKELVKKLSDDSTDLIKDNPNNVWNWSITEANTVSFNNYICMGFNDGLGNSAGGDNESYGDFITNKYYRNLPMWKTSFSSNLSKLFGGENAYLLISGNVIIGNHSSDGFVNPTYQMDSKLYKSTLWHQKRFIMCRLKYGSYYWNGSQWTTTLSDFKLYFDDSEDNKITNYPYSSKSLRNTVKWQDGLDSEGVACKTPSNNLMTDMVEFTMFCPYGYYDDANDMVTNFMWLSNFKILAVIGNPTYSDTADDDTVYSRIVDEDYTQELDEIKFKICTWDDKKPNYSSVAYKDGTNLKYVDTLYNVALSNKEIGTERYNNTTSTDGLLRLEEHCIYRIVNLYSTPSIKLSLSLRNNIIPYGLYTSSVDSTKRFIVDNINIDYRYNTADVNLIEKK